MKTDYDYYLLGCRSSEVVPLSRWRFLIAYAKYQKEFRRSLDFLMVDPDTPKNRRIIARWQWLFGLDILVQRGRDLAARAGRIGEDESGSAGAGDREPRVPLTPVLAGCGARPLPRRDEFFATLRL